MSFKVLYFRLCLVALISIARGFGLRTVQFCITVWPTFELTDEHTVINYEPRSLCPGESPVGVTRQFYIASGFAPGTRNLVAAGVLFPKWLDLWELLNEGDAKWLLEFGADYCLYHLSMSGQKHLGCAHSCYQQKQTLTNPYFEKKYGDDSPDFRDPVAGQINRYLPSPPKNVCPNPGSKGLYSFNDEPIANVAEKNVDGKWFTPGEDYETGIDTSTRDGFTKQADFQGPSEILANSAQLPNSNDEVQSPVLNSNSDTTPAIEGIGSTAASAGEMANWSSKRRRSKSKRGVKKFRMMPFQ